MLKPRILGGLVFFFSVTLAAQRPVAPTTPPTAQQVIDRIEGDFGTTFPPDTVDTFKAGDGATPVTGIVTTFLPTMDVLREAVARHENLILTHEPTFYNHRDETKLFTNDPVYKEKLAYINDHHLVIFRLHDTMHMAKPDRIFSAWVDAMGWQTYQDPDEPRYYTIPPTTVVALARELAARFNARSIRVVGDPDLRISHVALSLGAAPEATHITELEHPGVELLIAGEVSEWEAVEYVRDASLQGRHLALIVMGHNASEEIGMKPFADRIRELFPNLPVSFIPAGEPYWPVEHPRPLR